jgi:hypothetical protein
MSTENLIREILSKRCPYHGKHATVQIHSDLQMEITVCCKEFLQFIEECINDQTDGVAITKSNTNEPGRIKK